MEGATPQPPDSGGVTRRQVLVGAGVAGVALATASVGYELLRSSTGSSEHRARFVALSTQLTGYAPIELIGTGSVDTYYDWLRGAFPDELDELLGKWPAVARAPDRDAAMKREVLDDDKLGPFARGILGLWYTASWNQLPATWSKAYGSHPEDVNRSFASEYAGGLMWSAGGLHPQGARPPGFGTWSFAPEHA
jgi:hypothetical protein